MTGTPVTMEKDRLLVISIYMYIISGCSDVISSTKCDI